MEINIHFFVLLFLAIVAFISDIIIYFTAANYYVCIGLVSIFTALAMFCLIKKKLIRLSRNYDRTDLFLLISIIGIALVKGIVYPDYIYDVVSYHEYIQKNPFLDMVNYDFFPGRIYCIFLFPLGDRIYFILRSIFGYRFGMILSFYSVIVLFYQTKEILKLLTNGSKKSNLFAYLVFLNTTYLFYIGTYYIDCFALVFTLQVFLYALKYDDIFKSKTKLFLIFLISGISVGIKITQVFFIIPIMLYILVKNRKDIKEIKILSYFVCIFLAIVPYFVYMLNSYSQTGSILFPYYNEILKSDYFGDFNWVDHRFVIPNWISYILWPIIRGCSYVMYGDEFVYMDPIYSLSYIVVIIYMIRALIKKEKNIITSTLPVIILMYIVSMSVMYGYIRYSGVFGVILSLLMFAIIINAIDKYRVKSEKVRNSFMLIGLLYSIVICASTICVADLRNGVYLFRDTDKPEYRIDIDGVWGAPEDTLAYVSLVRDESDPIYNLHREYFESSEKALKMWDDKIKSNDIYTIIPCYYGDAPEETDVYELLADDNFEIDEVIREYTIQDIPYVNADSVWTLVKLKYVGE